MIGSAMLSVVSRKKNWQVYGSVRNNIIKDNIAASTSYCLITSGDLAVEKNLINLVTKVGPDVIINCAGITKHIPNLESPSPLIELNALLPHKLASITKSMGIRLIHISTDCVFSGKSGNYSEKDIPDADDVYGRTKQLGEVFNENCITVRTSTIGHEINTSYGLLEWFLAQKACRGYRGAIFSGLPTVEFARVVRDFMLPNNNLFGLYHVSSQAINKYNLLHLIAEEYQKKIEIIPDNEFYIDRSLNGALFNTKTGYEAPEWPDLIRQMHRYQINKGSIDV